MKRIAWPLLVGLWIATPLSFAGNPPTAPVSFKVMAYNVHNFIAVVNHPGKGHDEKPKPESEKDALYTLIAEEAPDILGLEEVGDQKFLKEIQEGLRAKGADYPHSEWIQGDDPTRHVCLLSRFPIVARDAHTHGEYHLAGRAMHVSRGFIEADVQVAPDYVVKVYVVHLKSKREIDVPGGADAMRLEEAKLLRKYVDEDLRAHPDANIVVMGDFNDTPDSPAIKTIRDSETLPLLDLKPVDEKGYSGTFYYRPSKHYDRIDYILLSPGLKNEYIEKSARIRDDATARKASDHFPVEASFKVGDQSPK